MSPEPGNSFNRANEVFSEALDLPGSQRESFVRQRCGSDVVFDEVMAMLASYSSLGGFLANPLAAGGLQPEFEVREGECLSGRFQILGRIGGGGMGEVYRALDTLSGEIVALKTLRSKFIGDRVTEDRFRDELKLARKISHNNICRIHELFTHQRGETPVFYFTMEFLEGETLADRLRRGALAPPETLAIARQIAAGMDAAHKAEVLHRDLKPANVILAGERVVITDFGLAKALKMIEAGDGHTKTGQVPGTPAYMPPEQFLGENLTKQSDVFAFGLIVFEMLKGRPPFPREDAGATLARNSDFIPAGWDRVVARALLSDPARRFASAGAMVKELERLRPIHARFNRRALLWGGGITAASLSGFFVASRLRNWEAELPTSPLVMLTPLTQSSDPLNSQVVDLLLARQLTQSAHARLLSADAVTNAWHRIAGTNGPLPVRLEPRVVRDIALRQGANFVVFGNLDQTGDEYVLRLRIELMGADPSHSRNTWTRDFPAPGRSDLPSAAFDGASWMRRTMGEAATDVVSRSRRPEELTTSSWQALEEFTKASEASKQHDEATALLHLQTALDLDPAFAQAAYRMADILTSINRFDDAMPYYQKAAALIGQKNLTDRESLRIRGLFLQDSGEEEEAERVLNRWAIEYSTDPLPLFYRATSLEKLGRVEETLALNRRAVEMDPKQPVFHENYAVRLLNAGKIAEAEAEAKQLAALESKDWADVLLSALAVGRDDLPEAWRRLQNLRAAGSPYFQSMAHHFQACFRAEEKRFADAVRLCREGLEFDAAHGFGSARLIKLRQMAQLSLAQQNKHGAAAFCEQILASKPGAQSAMEAGCILARAGELKAAQSCLRLDLPDWPVYRYWMLRLKGEIALAGKDSKRALDLFQQAPLRVPGLWREDIFLAASALGDRKVAAAQLTELFINPGRAWRVAQFGDPGFLIRAAEATPGFDLPLEQQKTADSLRKSFAQTISS